MQPTIFVHLLPTCVEASELAGTTAVVIDVLRATTTITTALAAGASAIIPCLEVDIARDRAQQCASPVLLGGERGGKKIAGFDLGNSPSEYLAAKVKSRTILFTTTNGTRAMDHCQQATRVLIASFINISAVTKQIPSTAQVHLVCAGTDGQVSLEDLLLAGAIAGSLRQRETAAVLGNDSAHIAHAAWQHAQQESRRISLETIVSRGAGAQNLIRVGLGHDISTCVAMDTCTTVPEMDPTTGTIC